MKALLGLVLGTVFITFPIVWFRMDHVRERVDAAVDRLDVRRVRRPKPTEWRVVTRATPRSLGERVRISCRDLGDGRIHMDVRSRPLVPTNVFEDGANEANVSTIRSSLCGD